MYILSSLYALRQHIGLDAADTSEDGRLLDALSAASAAIERRTRRSFQPRVESITHNVDLWNVVELSLKDDLLEIQSIINGDGSSIALSDVMLIDNSLLRLTNGEVFTFEETADDAITVTGIWGYHPYWSQAWSDSGDTVQDAPISASANSVTVTDADAGTVPRFQVGQLLRIEDEYLHVVAIDTGTNILTVERGVNGTSAASHSNGTPIDIYQIPSDVAQIALRWALWLYREPDSFMTTFPSVLLDTLDGLRRISVRN